MILWNLKIIMYAHIHTYIVLLKNSKFTQKRKKPEIAHPKQFAFFPILLHFDECRMQLCLSPYKHPS